MVAIYILLAVVLLLLFILLLSVRITVEYNSDVSLKVGALFYNYSVVPSAGKKKKSKKKKKDEVASGEEAKGKPDKKKSTFSEFTEGLEIADFIEILTKLLTRLAAVFKKHLRVRLNKYLITVGAESPDKAAILFGTVNTASMMLIEYLTVNTRLHPLENSPVAVRCDFEGKTVDVDVKVVIKIRVIHLITYLVGAFFDFMKIKESKNSKTSLKGTIKNERK